MVHCSTHRSLLPEEVKDEKELRRKFDSIIEEKLDLNAVAKDFGEMSLEETPTFENYEDDSVEGNPDEPPEELEPTPDLSMDVYVNASIALPQGGRLAQGEVIRRKRYVDGNPIGR